MFKICQTLILFFALTDWWINITQGQLSQWVDFPQIGAMKKNSWEKFQSKCPAWLKLGCFQVTADVLEPTPCLEATVYQVITESTSPLQAAVWAVCTQRHVEHCYSWHRCPHAEGAEEEKEKRKFKKSSYLHFTFTYRPLQHTSTHTQDEFEGEIDRELKPSGKRRIHKDQSCSHLHFLHHRGLVSLNLTEIREKYVSVDDLLSFLH